MLTKNCWVENWLFFFWGGVGIIENCLRLFRRQRLWCDHTYQDFGTLKAETLEMMVKYHQEAFTKAWVFLASTSRHGEDDYIFVTFFFSPWKRGKVPPFLGRLMFFRPFAHAG